MDIKDFVNNFSSQFVDVDANRLSAQTKFRVEIEEWDSLSALGVIAMVDEVYGVAIKGDEIRKSNTVEDLFNIVKSRK